MDAELRSVMKFLNKHPRVRARIAAPRAKTVVCPLESRGASPAVRLARSDATVIADLAALGRVPDTTL
jgi:hypothetical protein